MEQDYDTNTWEQPCPVTDCRKKPKCECGLEFIEIPSVLGDDSDESSVTPENGKYCNAIVKYAANGHIYIYSKEGIPTEVENGNISTILEELQQEIIGLTNGKQNKLTAGDNITITDNVISADSGSKTIFYANTSETGITRHIYSDEACTVAATAQELSDASQNGLVTIRNFNINTPTQFNEVTLLNVWQSPNENDYQFVFAGDGWSYTYGADTLADDTFYYHAASYLFGNRVQTTGSSTTDLMSQKATTDAINAMAVVKNTAPTTSTVGVLGQLYTDTTDMHTYQCTAISGNTYVWTMRW